MTMDEAYTAIRDRMNAEWPLINSTVPVAYPNENFQGPNGNAFLLLEVTWAGGAGLSIGAPGSNWTVRDGNLYLRAFTPIGAGQLPGIQIVRQARGIFEDLDMGGGLIFLAMEPGGGMSNSDDGQYYCQEITLPFWLHEAV